MPERETAPRQREWTIWNRDWYRFGGSDLDFSFKEGRGLAREVESFGWMMAERPSYLSACASRHPPSRVPSSQAVHHPFLALSPFTCYLAPSPSPRVIA